LLFLSRGTRLLHKESNSKGTGPWWAGSAARERVFNALPDRDWQLLAVGGLGRGCALRGGGDWRTAFDD